MAAKRNFDKNSFLALLTAKSMSTGDIAKKMRCDKVTALKYLRELKAEKRVIETRISSTSNVWELNFENQILIGDCAETLKLAIVEPDLNELNGSEWTQLSKSVQRYNSPITMKRKAHGAAFPFDLAQHFIKIYSKKGDTVFDPFVGVGTALDAANTLERHAYGTEINEEFIKLFNLGIDPKDGILNPEYDRVIISDTVFNLTKYIHHESIDLIVTSPPYANLLNLIRREFADKDFKGNIYKNQSRKLAKPYSEHEEDLGN